jgi:hypothetical protein
MFATHIKAAVNCVIASTAGLYLLLASCNSPTTAPQNQIRGVIISPGDGTISLNSTRQFSAAAMDQAGALLVPQPVVTWEASGGGTISASGLFTAGNIPGRYTVVASVGPVSDSVRAIVASPETPMILISPDGGETSRIGDSLSIKWRANPDSAIGMLLSISFDAGRTYWPIYGNQSIGTGGKRDTSVQWEIPDSLFDIRNGSMVAVPVSSLCKVRISDYLDNYATYSEHYFSVIRE